MTMILLIIVRVIVILLFLKIVFYEKLKELNRKFYQSCNLIQTKFI